MGPLEFVLWHAKKPLAPVFNSESQVYAPCLVVQYNAAQIKPKLSDPIPYNIGAPLSTALHSHRRCTTHLCINFLQPNFGDIKVFLLQEPSGLQSFQHLQHFFECGSIVRVILHAMLCNNLQRKMVNIFLYNAGTTFCSNRRLRMVTLMLLLEPAGHCSWSFGSPLIFFVTMVGCRNPAHGLSPVCMEWIKTPIA